MPYIATEAGGKDRHVAIYGTGDSPTEARLDAENGNNGEPCDFDVLEATPRLVEVVRERGGSPHDVSWAVNRNGVAFLLDRSIG